MTKLVSLLMILKDSLLKLRKRYIKMHIKLMISLNVSHKMKNVNTCIREKEIFSLGIQMINWGVNNILKYKIMQFPKTGKFKNFKHGSFNLKHNVFVCNYIYTHVKVNTDKHNKFSYPDSKKTDYVMHIQGLYMCILCML